MKILLTSDIHKLGNAGDVLKVADGYARNFLIPRGLAIPATTKNLGRVQKIRDDAEKKRQEKEAQLRRLAEKIGALRMVFVRKADENGHLFGSVSEIDIAHELEKAECPVHKSMIQMEKHLKDLGNFEIAVQLAANITATVKVVVEDEKKPIEPVVEDTPAQD